MAVVVGFYFTAAHADAIRLKFCGDCAGDYWAWAVCQATLAVVQVVIVCYNAGTFTLTLYLTD